MSDLQEQITSFVSEIEKLHARHELAFNKPDNYYNPGNMEYLEQSDGVFDASNGLFMMRFESRGTRYNGRTEQIEHVKADDVIRIKRDAENIHNSNNFVLLTTQEIDVGNMPAELCNVIAPLYDTGNLTIESAVVTFVDPISKRSRYAKQAMLFVEVKGYINILNV